MRYKSFFTLVLCVLLLFSSEESHAISSCDTNRDGVITPIDVLSVINYLNSLAKSSNPKKLDVNQDGNVTAMDVLTIINYLNAGATGKCGKDLSDVEGLSLGSPEEFGSVDATETPTLPSTPPPSNTPSPSLSPSPSVSVSPSETPSPSNSPSPSPSISTPVPTPTPICPNPGESKDSTGVCCPSSSIDSCGVCYGPGPNICTKSCGMGPFPPESMPNKCGGCGNEGINECGSCANSPGEIVKGCDGVCGSGKVYSGCDNTCGSTKAFDKCGVCGGNGASCQCVWAAGWADFSNATSHLTDGQGGFHELSDIYNTLKDRLEPATKKLPACFEEIADAAFCVYRKDVDTSTTYWGGCNYPATEEERSRRKKMVEECKVRPSIRCFLLSSIFGEVGPNSFMGQIKAFARLLGVPDNKMMEFQVPPLRPDASPAVWWFVDDQCKYRETTPDTKICGFAGYSWSPISLMLDDESSLENDMNVVEFSLAPTSSSNFTLWKGSAQAPLLVYDPENVNLVTSATQLFGNYAFGGKTDTLDEYRKIKDQPWQDGYKALALLDRNKDQKVSGDELADLKLWFDYNRNAVSEKGELKKLAEVGIVTLYYSNPTSIENGKDIHMNVGFDMIKDGVKVTRPTIDWYTESFDSKNEAAVALRAKFGAKRATLVSDNQISDSATGKNSSEIKINENDPITKNISGYWTWTLSGKAEKLGPGFFVFGQDSESGEITARSIMETVLSKNSQKLRSAMASIPGEGHAYLDSEGKLRATVTFSDKSTGGSSITTAKLSDDGMMLRGTTTQSYEVKVGEKVQKASLDYEWIATRINFK